MLFLGKKTCRHTLGQRRDKVKKEKEKMRVVDEAKSQRRLAGN